MIKIGIVGGTGYTGVELLRLLARYIRKLRRCAIITSRKEAGTPVCRDVPQPARMGTISDLRYSDPAATPTSRSCDVVFFATPHGVAMSAGTRARRRRCQDHRSGRGFPAQGPRRVRAAGTRCRTRARILLAESVYGLPEMHRDADPPRRASSAIPGAIRRRSSSGFLPLVEAGVVDRRAPDRRRQIRSLGRRTQGRARTDVQRGIRQLQGVQRRRPPAPSGDRAGPRRVLSRTPVTLVFTPHLTPMIRGIHATLYARLTDTDVDLQALFEKRYAGEPFVDVMPRRQPSGHALGARRQRLPDCRSSARRAGTSQSILAVDRQPRQGRRRAGGPEHEPDVRPARDDRA